MSYQQAKRIVVKAAQKQGLPLGMGQARAQALKNIITAKRQIDLMISNIRRGELPTESAQINRTYRLLGDLSDFLAQNNMDFVVRRNINDAKTKLWVVMNVDPVVRPDLGKRSSRIMFSALQAALKELDKAKRRI